MFNIFRRKSNPVSSNKPILKGSFDNGTITLTHNDIVVCRGDIHDFNTYLRENKIPRVCVVWSEYDPVKESFWNRRYD